MAGFALGAVLGGAVALLASAAGKRVSQRRRVVVGGVDLSNVDGSQPFLVDFSVDPEATTEEKRAALSKLRTAFVEIQAAYPFWLCQTEAAARLGRFVLHVQPLHPPANAVGSFA